MPCPVSRQRSSPSLVIEDFLVVIFTHTRAHRRISIAAPWLATVPHVIFTESPFLQNGSHLCFHTLPEGQDDPSTRGFEWLGHTNGDGRQALAVHAANASFWGAFRWMVLCDDDSMLFMERLRMMLRGIDTTLPLYLGSPFGGASCLSASERRLQPLSCCSDWRQPCRVGWIPPSGCTQHGLALNASSSGLCLPDRRIIPPDGLVESSCRECFCPVRRTSEGRFRLDLVHGLASLLPALRFGYGGKGVLLSAGLLASMPSHHWLRCARRLQCGPSDFRVATCVQNLAGIGLGDLNAAPGRLLFTTKRAQDPALSLAAWPYSVHKLNASTSHFLWQAYLRQLQSRVHASHVCDRTTYALQGVASEVVWSGSFPSVLEQDEVEEYCIQLLGTRSGWYQLRNDSHGLVCAVVLAATSREDESVAARDSVLRVVHQRQGQRISGGVCWTKRLPNGSRARGMAR